MAENTELPEALQPLARALATGGTALDLAAVTGCTKPTVYTRLRHLQALGFELAETKVRSKGSTRGPLSVFYKLAPVKPAKPKRSRK